ncbi:hypothetical protein ACFQJD_10470 [Haloplanus sp. GCM10025708]|uniref:hypothetical protein n=1 Tax=Haloplanus sp. GCM10025708 TaxID=3252679 RepID=UPI003610D3ED
MRFPRRRPELRTPVGSASPLLWVPTGDSTRRSTANSPPTDRWGTDDPEAVRILTDWEQQAD